MCPRIRQVADYLIRTALVETAPNLPRLCAEVDARCVHPPLLSSAAMLPLPCTRCLNIAASALHLLCFPVAKMFD